MEVEIIYIPINCSLKKVEKEKLGAEVEGGLELKSQEWLNGKAWGFLKTHRRMDRSRQGRPITGTIKISPFLWVALGPWSQRTFADMNTYFI